MTAAFNRRDDAASEAVAAADADFVTVTGNWTKGAKAYTEARRKRFAGALKNASIAPIETQITMGLAFAIRLSYPAASGVSW